MKKLHIRFAGRRPLLKRLTVPQACLLVALSPLPLLSSCPQEPSHDLLKPTLHCIIPLLEPIIASHETCNPNSLPWLTKHATFPRISLPPYPLHSTTPHHRSYHGDLFQLFSLPGMLFPDILQRLLCVIQDLFKCHLPRQSLPNHLGSSTHPATIPHFLFLFYFSAQCLLAPVFPVVSLLSISHYQT